MSPAPRVASVASVVPGRSGRIRRFGRAHGPQVARVRTIGIARSPGQCRSPRGSRTSRARRPRRTRRSRSTYPRVSSMRNAAICAGLRRGLPGLAEASESFLSFRHVRVRKPTRRRIVHSSLVGFPRPLPGWIRSPAGPAADRSPKGRGRSRPGCVRPAHSLPVETRSRRGGDARGARGRGSRTGRPVGTDRARHGLRRPVTGSRGDARFGRAIEFDPRRHEVYLNR